MSTKHKYIDVILVTLLPFETRTVLYLSKLVIGGAPKGELKKAAVESMHAKHTTPTCRGSTCSLVYKNLKKHHDFLIC